MGFNERYNEATNERIKREEREKLEKTAKEEKIIGLIKSAVKWGSLVIVVSSLAMCSIYQVEEGHVGIIKTFGEATEQVGAGLHFKSPIGQTVEELEVRTRKNVETLPAATSEQMAANATVSVNWTVNKVSALDLFIAYGSLEQFEQRILDPRLRSASKTAISRYTAEDLIRNRGKAIGDIEAVLAETMSEFPVKLDSVQIENIQLPQQYMASIQEKQTEKNKADAEKHKLARQKLEAQRLVQTAEAERDARQAKADGQAYAIKAEAEAQAEAIRFKGLAEAEAIEAKAKSLAGNPLIVQLTAAQRWNGAQPQTVLSGGENLFMNMSK